jgi:hypothetical protein
VVLTIDPGLELAGERRQVEENLGSSDALPLEVDELEKIFELSAHGFDF